MTWQKNEIINYEKSRVTRFKPHILLHKDKHYTAILLVLKYKKTQNKTKLICVAECKVLWLWNKKEYSPFIVCKTKYFRAPKVGRGGSWRNHYVNNNVDPAPKWQSGNMSCRNSQCGTWWRAHPPGWAGDWTSHIHALQAASRGCRTSSHILMRPLTADGKLINCLLEAAGLW